MFKKTFKLLGLFILLVLSFIYTDKVFSIARQKDPVMKKVMSFKRENDIPPTESVISGDEIVLGYAGLIVNAKESYKKMKPNDKFDKDKIVYEKKLPKISISNNYDYYIKNGNTNKNAVSIILKVNNTSSPSKILSYVKKVNASFNFFVDYAWISKNIEDAFNMVNLNQEIYNLGYDGVYSKNTILQTNNLIESITLKDASFCLNEDKNDLIKKMCSSKKMYSIVPTLISPSIVELKENLKKGMIIAYNIDDLSTNDIGVILKLITSRGYKIEGLSQLISEERE